MLSRVIVVLASERLWMWGLLIVGLWWTAVSLPDEMLVSGYGWQNTFQNAQMVATGQTRFYDYFRDPLYSVLLNGTSMVTGTYWSAASILGWGIWIGMWGLLLVTMKVDHTNK